MSRTETDLPPFRLECSSTGSTMPTGQINSISLTHYRHALWHTISIYSRFLLPCAKPSSRVVRWCTRDRRKPSHRLAGFLRAAPPPDRLRSQDFSRNTPESLPPAPRPRVAGLIPSQLSCSIQFHEHRPAVRGVNSNDFLRSTIVLLAKRLYEQSQNFYLGHFMFRHVVGRLGSEDLNALKHVM